MMRRIESRIDPRSAEFRRFREANLAVSSINETGLQRLERFQALWNRQPEAVLRSGSHSVSVAHAMTRLNSLYNRFFAPAPRDRQPPPGARY